MGKILIHAVRLEWNFGELLCRYAWVRFVWNATGKGSENKRREKFRDILLDYMVSYYYTLCGAILHYVMWYYTTRMPYGTILHAWGKVSYYVCGMWCNITCILIRQKIPAFNCSLSLSAPTSYPRSAFPLPLYPTHALKITVHSGRAYNSLPKFHRNPMTGIEMFPIDLPCSPWAPITPLYLKNLVCNANNNFAKFHCNRENGLGT